MARVEDWGNRVCMRRRVTLCDLGMARGSRVVGMAHVTVQACDGAEGETWPTWLCSRWVGLSAGAMTHVTSQAGDG